MSGVDELLAERDFLLERARSVHRRQFGSDVGRSSEAMLLHAIGVADRPKVPGWTVAQAEVVAAGRPITTGPVVWTGDQCGMDYPHDEDDLGRCERTFAAAPPHLQERMRPVLDEFTAWVRERRNRHGVVLPR